MQALAKQN
jgi:protein phosphatase